MSEPTIKDAIDKAILQAGGRAQLRQIYESVMTLKTLKSKTPQESIRSDLYRGIEGGRFVRNSDGTYSISEQNVESLSTASSASKVNEHDTVIQSLFDLCTSYAKYQSGGVHREEIFPKPALIPIGKGSHVQFPYVPDVWVKRKDRRFDIYEVWDSEDDAKAFFEIFRVAFTPEVQYYSVVCVNRGKGWWTRANVIEHIKGVLDNLKEPGVEYARSIGVAEVDLETVKDRSKLRNSLVKQLEF